MDAVVRILRYLKYAPEKILIFLKHGHVKSTIKIAENPVQHDRKKHVEIDRNFIYEKLEEKIIEVPYVKTTEQLADMLTKAVSNQAFIDSLVKLGICNIYAPS
ncbi:hypothetical protein L3X38_033773 [Prunus dulcis]|uniref:Copia protein n=1 Tax=Prunus dulcis TaxID=3755 RepID=A0AAD4YX84_PRUDU|nr:hypothetical protein L3X38_033773 [Prunus dulcis]